MDAYKIQFKLFADTSKPVALEAAVPVFHDWIRHKVLPELMIDVAPYDHVPNGPGILFVGHASDYYFEDEKGRPGLLYSRKRDPVAPGERLRDGLRRLVNVATRLEADQRLSGLRFDTSELLFRINDRLLARNDDASFVTLRPELEAFFKEIYSGLAFTLTRVGDPRELFTVSVKLTDPGSAPDLATLLARLGGAPTAS